MRKVSIGPGKQPSVTSLFFSMGLDMSWRLALSVLVPIIGGVELDKHFGTAPVLLIAGFVVAIALAIVTIRRTLQLSKQLPFDQLTKGMKKVEDDDDD